jgi:hypothetical protein
MTPQVPTYQDACDYIKEVTHMARVNLLQGLSKLPADDYNSPLARLLQGVLGDLREIERISKDGDLSEEFAKARAKLRL